MFGRSIGFRDLSNTIVNLLREHCSALAHAAGCAHLQFDSDRRTREHDTVVSEVVAMANAVPEDFVPGLEGVVAFTTDIAEPDKNGGNLRYRGVDIEDLV